MRSVTHRAHLLLLSVAVSLGPAFAGLSPCAAAEPVDQRTGAGRLGQAADGQVVEEVGHGRHNRRVVAMIPCVGPGLFLTAGLGCVEAGAVSFVPLL